MEHRLQVPIQTEAIDERLEVRCNRLKSDFSVCLFA